MKAVILEVWKQVKEETHNKPKPMVEIGVSNFMLYYEDIFIS